MTRYRVNTKIQIGLLRVHIYSSDILFKTQPMSYYIMYYGYRYEYIIYCVYHAIFNDLSGQGKSLRRYGTFRRKDYNRKIVLDNKDDRIARDGDQLSHPTKSRSWTHNGLNKNWPSFPLLEAQKLSSHLNYVYINVQSSAQYGSRIMFAASFVYNY